MAMLARMPAEDAAVLCALGLPCPWIAAVHSRAVRSAHSGDGARGLGLGLTLRPPAQARSAMVQSESSQPAASRKGHSR
jgi:hypothetical protein